MPQIHAHKLARFGNIALLMLVSCTSPAVEQLSASPAEELLPSEQIDQPTAPTENLLTPAQMDQLTALPLPIVAPSYLPEGFQVVRVDGESVPYVDGSYDAGYVIEYQREDGTCFTIMSSKDGPRGLSSIGQVETALGPVSIYESRYEGSTTFLSYFPVDYNPMMMSPVSRLNPETGEYEQCNPLDLQDYERILESIEVVQGTGSP
jgi:hypothetical protein